MEKTNIPYEAWPDWIKTLTAFRIKSLTMKDPKSMNGLSGVNIGVGLLLLAQLFFDRDLPNTATTDTADLWMMFLAVLNIIAGIYNLLYTKKAIAWIRDNSSWAERDRHKSTGKHKLFAFLILIIITGISWGIACLFYC